MRLIGMKQETKQCSKCLQVRTTDNFGSKKHTLKNGNVHYYVLSICKDCEKNRSAERYRKDPEKFKQSARISTAKQKEKDPIKYNKKMVEYVMKSRKNHMPETAEYMKRWWIENPEKHIYINAKSRAKKKNVPFTLDLSHVIIPTHCPIFGTEMKKGKIGDRESSPSLDRMIPNEGYTPENSVVMSFRANRFKNDATIEELEMVIAFMKKHRDERMAKEKALLEGEPNLASC